jgi:hypothetical protein
MAKTVSGKVKKTPPSEVSPERYDFIELAETEPDLGVPITDGYVLASAADGTRQWVDPLAIGSSGLTSTDNLSEGTTNKYFTVGRVSYEHTQGAVSNSWVINHNLGFQPNVTVVDSAGTIYEGEIAYTNTNSLTVTFSSAFSGMAYLS